MCCSVAMVTIRTIGKRVSALSLAGWFHACSTVMGAISMLARWPLAPVMPSPTEWALLILLAVTSFFGQLSLNYGYSHLPTLVASAMYYLMVVWSAVLGVLVMREGMDAYGAAGAAVICAGGLGPSANKARLRRREESRRRRAGAEPSDAATN
jgi:drug/metabolite transporter (DMT)-like permease